MDSDEHTRSICEVLDLRAALCVAMDGGWRPTSMVCWCRSDGGEDSAQRRR